MTREQRRSCIIEAAAAEFARMGYHGATIVRIAAACACSQPTLYKHFADKRALLIACLEHTEQQVERDIDAIVDHPDRLTAWLEYVDGSLEYRRMLQLRMLCSTLHGDDELLAYLRAGTERLLDRFRRMIEGGARDGTLEPRADAEQIAWTWLGLSLAACYGAAVEGEDRYRAVMRSAARVLASSVSPAH